MAQGKTVRDLVDDVHQAAIARGMDVSPSDVGFLISLFLEGFVDAASLETFDPAKHDVLVWLGCAGAFEADYQKSMRSLFGMDLPFHTWL